jgi:hypothetical protein
MEKASVIEMRQSLEIVEEFKKYGIRFVPVPVLDAFDYAAIMKMSENILKAMINEFCRVNHAELRPSQNVIANELGLDEL